LKEADLEPKIALFIDYDNIAIGLKESGGQRFEVSRILERLLEKGRIIYKRAYADWSLFSDAKQALHDAAIEMVDIPMRRHIGKNSADIRLVVDALDLCYTKEHIDTFVIGSGDSDFSPLVSKLKENDKQVIGFGLRGSTSSLLADNCDEFIYYEDLISLPISRPPLPPGLTVRQSEAFTILLDTIAALMRENKDILWGSLVKDTIRRKQPAFSESRYGYSTFSQLLEDAAQFGLIGLIKDPKSGGTPVVTGYGKFSGGEGSATRLSRPTPGTTVRGPSLQVRSEPARLSSTNGEGEKTSDTSKKTLKLSANTNGDGAGKADEADVSRRAKSTIHTKKPVSRRRLPSRIKSNVARTAQKAEPSEPEAAANSTLPDSQKDETIMGQMSTIDNFTGNNSIFSTEKGQEAPSAKEVTKPIADADSSKTGAKQRSSRPVRQLKRIRRR